MTIKRRLYANNAKTTLALDITPSDTAIQVTDGSLFPTPALGEYFLATLEFGSSIEIVKVTGRSGNTFTGCVRGQEDKPALSFQAGIKVGNRVTRDTLKSFESNIGLMDRLDSLDLLDTPLKSNTNAYICHTKDSSGNSSVAIKNSDTAWRFLTHSTVAVTGNVDSATAFSIVSSSIGNKLISIVPGKYIVQFMTGNNRGLCRSITAVNNNGLGWFTALPEFPAVNDQFEVYMSDSSTLGDGTGIIPITSGGTGGITAPAALVNLGAVAKSGDTLTGAINFAAPVVINVANANTVATTNSNNITINGAGTITALGSIPAGAVRLLTFNGIVTFTHNPTSLILPTSANIITAAGDTATMVSLGSGNWKCTSFQKFNGQPLVGINSTEYVQQGGGAGQSTNKVYIGFATAGGLKATVDSTDQGYFAFSSAKDSITTWMPVNTTGVVTAEGFIGNGVALTNVNAVNTNSISNATDKTYGWTGVQYFYSNSQASTGTFGPPNTSLRVSDKTSGTSAAAMTFVRENLYGVNMGIEVNNNFVIGGYSNNGNLLTLSQTGNLSIAGTISGTSLYGNGSNLTGFTATQIVNALTYTPVRQGGGVGQLSDSIKIGYSIPGAGLGSGVKVTVGVTDFGFMAFSSLANVWRTDKPITTDSSVTASYFSGNGGGLTSVVATDTSSITSALNKNYKWAGTTQTFPSYAQTGIWEGTLSSTHSQLHVAGNSSSAATMTFIREGLYAVNVGLDIDNVWGVGGYSAGAGRLMYITPSGDFNAKNSVTTGTYYGNIASTTGLTSGQVTTALGFTPINSSGINPGAALDIGRYLDFRLTAVDYDARIECTVPGKLKTWGNFEVANNLDVYGGFATAGNINSQQDIIAAGKFTGNGVGLTNVTAINTTSITGALNKAYTWTKSGQVFTSEGVSSSLTGGISGLSVFSYDGNTAAISLVRNGLYGLNFGLNSANEFVIGGYSSNITRMILNVTGDLTIPGTYSGAGFSGNGAGLSNVTAINTNSIAGSVTKPWTWTAIQKFQCSGLATTTTAGEPNNSLRVTSPGTGAAAMSFIRDGVHGINVGLDTDNSFNIGGLSVGVMSKLTQAGNYSVPGSITAGAGGFIGLGSGITGITNPQIITALGYTPIQQGGGTGQGNNKVYLGWGASNGGLRCTVDALDVGYVPMSSTNPTNGSLTFNNTITSAGFFGPGGGLSNVTATNTTSIAGALGNLHVWANNNTFLSYRNIYYAGDSGGLVVASQPGVGAVMTFLRSGYFALNMGLDSDNIFKLGGYSIGEAALIAIDSSGNFTALGNITAYSDKRIKKDIEPIRNALDTILKLRGVTFNRISDGKKGRGFVAQEVEEVYPELVHTEVSGEHMKSVAYGNFTGDIVEALRELNDRLTAIEKRLEDR